MKRMAIFLTEKQIADLRTLAKESGVPMAEMLRRLLDKALEQEKRQRARDAR